MFYKYFFGKKKEGYGWLVGDSMVFIIYMGEGEVIFVGLWKEIMEEFKFVNVDNIVNSLGWDFVVLKLFYVFFVFYFWVFV